MRFRFRDSSFSGWRYRLTGALGGAWQTFGVSFDTHWTDLQAQANGWQTDLPGGAGGVGRAQRMGDVYTTEIRMDGTSTLLAGVDNFSLYTTAVPEPSSWLLMAGGLGALSWMARRRRH